MSPDLQPLRWEGSERVGGVGNPGLGGPVGKGQLRTLHQPHPAGSPTPASTQRAAHRAPNRLTRALPSPGTLKTSGFLTPPPPPTTLALGTHTVTPQNPRSPPPPPRMPTPQTAKEPRTHLHLTPTPAPKKAKTPEKRGTGGSLPGSHHRGGAGSAMSFQFSAWGWGSAGDPRGGAS